MCSIKSDIKVEQAMYISENKKKTVLLQEIQNILDIKSLNLLKRDNTSSSLLQCYIFGYIWK